jgi:hypothetical protein
MIDAGSAAVLLQFFRVADEMRDEQIERAVTVVVEPDSGSRNARGVQTRTLGYVLERSVAAIAIQRVVRVAGDQQVDPAVAIVIRGSGSEGEESGLSDTGAHCNVGELSVPRRYGTGRSKAAEP